MYGFHNMSNIEKFRSGNLLENGNKNQWNLPCGNLLLFLICTWSFGKNSLLRVHMKYNKNSPHGKFHRFLFPFSSKFPDLKFAPYVLFIYSCYETGTWHKKWAWVTCGENPLTLLVRKYIEIGYAAMFEWSWKWKVTIGDRDVAFQSCRILKMFVSWRASLQQKWWLEGHATFMSKVVVHWDLVQSVLH